MDYLMMSKRINSAKELWEKIKYLYLDEAYQLKQSSVYNKSSDEDSFEEE